MITVPSGTSITIRETFLDEYGIPLVPDTAPTVSLFDNSKDLAHLSYANPDTVPGTWVANIQVPVLENKDTLEFSVVWLFTCNGDNHRSRENILVEPSVQERESEAVALEGDEHFLINVPFLTSEIVANCDFFDNNEQIYSMLSSNDLILKRENFSSTNLALPLNGLAASMYSKTLMVRYTKNTIIPETLTYKVWIVTPAILNAASQLENFVNKSRISNVIPELRYAQSDLLLALSRGLEMFNSIGPTLSSFTGTNMQGALLDSWIICSCINLLNMQYMAEGSLAFDFSGQSVSLNIDRTQYIDSMLGRLDSMVENQVKPLKKLLAKSGITSGDGSIGSKQISGNFGITTLSLSPTTKLYGYSPNRFRRYW